MFTTLLYAGDVSIIEMMAELLLYSLVLFLAAAILIGLYMFLSSKIFPPEKEQPDKLR